MSFRLALAIACIVSLGVAGPRPKAAGQQPAEFTRFEAIYGQVLAVNQRLEEVKQRFAQETDQEARDALRNQMEASTKESHGLMPQLREAGIAAYEVAPNEHELINLTLVALIQYDTQHDNYESAMKLVRLMEGKGYKNPLFDALAGVAAYRMDDYETAEPFLQKGLKEGKLDSDAQQMLGYIAEQKRNWSDELAIRRQDAAADDLPRVKLETNKGTMVLELFENEAPQTVANFVNLVESHFYDGLTFHRVLPGFVAQGGDPNGDGTGGPGYQILCECRDRENFRRHFRGSLSMAHAGRDTGGSQFFLTFAPARHLDGKHTVFGRVIEGLDVLALIQRRDPTGEYPAPPDKIVKAEVLRKRDHKYEPTKVK